MSIFILEQFQVWITKLSVLSTFEENSILLATIFRKIDGHKNEAWMAFKAEAMVRIELSSLNILVRQWQVTLVSLLDKLNAFCKGITEEMVQKAEVVLSEALEELLEGVYLEYAENINILYKVPNKTFEAFKTVCLQDYQKARSFLENRKEDPFLIKILDAHFENPMNTYQDVVYNTNFAKELSAIQPFEMENNLKQDVLSKYLAHLNFNHDRFIAYLMRQMHNKLERMETLSDKLRYLHQQHRIFTHLTSQQQWTLFPLLPGVVSMMLSSIEYEIDYQPYSDPSSYIHDVAEGNGISRDHDKFTVEVSVKLLALFIRLLKEVTVFRRGTVFADLLRFIIKHFATIQQPAISYASFYQHFHRPQPPTVKIMRACLKKMLSTLDSFS